MNLENRAYLLSKGFLTIGNDKKEDPVIGLSMLKRANSEMLATYSLSQMRIKAAAETVKHTH
jgi:hypothetical protein